MILMRRLYLCGVMCLVALGILSPQGRAQKAASKSGQETRPPTWAVLKAGYEYDTKKPLKVKEEISNSETAYVVHIQIEGAEGKKAPGVFMRPRAEGVYPVVLLLHGLTSDKETMLKFFGEPLVAQGVAVLALDAPYHGERKDPKVNPGQPTVFPLVVEQGCLEWRRALDYLARRNDVDSKHIGLLGYSMGSMMGSILGGVDERIKAFALCVGGDPILPLASQIPPPLRDLAYAVSPSLFIGHIAPRPVIMLNGKQDTTMPAAASNRLYAAAREPKEQQMFDSGHLLPHDAGMKAVTWILAKVKPSP